MTIKLTSGFEIAKFSDLNFEEITVEIRFKGSPLAQLNKDKGSLHPEVEIPSRFSPEDGRWSFPVGDLIEALEEARKYLASL